MKLNKLFFIEKRTSLKNKRYGLVLFLCLTFMSAFAQGLKLNRLLTDHMVLQREDVVNIYGFGIVGNQIEVSFAGQHKSTKVSEDGSWLVKLDPMKASFKPRSLKVSDTRAEQEIILEDVLVGDVWLCAGQSNMDRPVRAYSELKKMLAEVNVENLRIVDVNQELAIEPKNDLTLGASFKGTWQYCKGDVIQYFSPAAYYFGKKLVEELKVPIGLIESARGATNIQPWIAKPVLENINQSTDLVYKKGKIDFHSPSLLYNGMIYPVKDFVFKGVIWYQGESNAMKPIEYAELFNEMIKSWRVTFSRGNIPFYFAQLASFKTPKWSTPELAPWAWLRESQSKALKQPNTSMVVTIDLGEFEDIHPQNKEQVGNRFAFLELKEQGMVNLAQGPMYKSMTIKKKKCIIEFDYVGDGLKIQKVIMNRDKNLPIMKDPNAFISPNDKLVGFSICGVDKVFYKAKAKIVDNTVVVYSKKVKKPIAVRYGWENFSVCNLYNVSSLPAAPFRTDNFLPPSNFKK